MKHVARIVIVAGIVGIGVAAPASVAHGDRQPGWYVGMSQGSVHLVDPTAQRQLVGPYAGRDLALSADGSTLAAVTSDTLRVLDAHTLVSRAFRFLGGARFGHVALSPDGAQIALGSGHGTVLFYDWAHAEFLQTVSLGEVRIGDVEYSPDGRYVYATTALPTPAPPPSGALIVIDAHAQQVVDRIDLAPDARRMMLSAEGSVAYVAAGLSLWQVDLAQRRTIRSWYAGQPVADVALARDGRHAYIVFGDSDSASLATIDLNGEGLQSTQQLAGCSEPNRIELAADGRSLAITLERLGALILVDIDTAGVHALVTQNVPIGLIATDLAGITALPSQPLRAITPAALLTCGTAIALEHTAAAPGETIDVAVRIESEADIDIAGTQNEIIFDPRVLELDVCRVDPSIGNHDACDEAEAPTPCKNLYQNVDPCRAAPACPSGFEDWTTIRTVVLSIANTRAIPPGTAYRCRFRIRDDAAPETITSLRCQEAGASDPDGTALPIMCRDGSVSIAVPATPTPVPTPTSNVPAIDVPLGSDNPSVTVIDAGGCQTTRVPAPISIFLLAPPLLALALRRWP